jgi:two-component system sensor histidine kinase MtrB
VDTAGTAAAHAPGQADGCADPRVAIEVGALVDAIWRRSLQVRVVVSTLALSAAVVLVLGLVLQTQIAGRILQGKEVDALGQAEAGAAVLERELAGVDPDGEGAQGELNKALDRLTNASLSDDAGSPSAGEFRAVLTTGPREPGGVDGPGVSEVSAGTVADVPADLRGHVAGGSLARRYVTIAAGASRSRR